MKLKIRDVIADDLPILFEHQCEREANVMAAFPARERGAFMTHWTKLLEDSNTIKKAVIVDGEVAGNVVCFERSGKREVGYWIGKTFWGRGIATEALSRVLDEVTERPLYARVAKHNAGSLRVLEKNGFARIGEDRFALETGEVIEEFVFRLD